MKLSYGSGSVTMQSGIGSERRVDLNAFAVICFQWRRPIFQAGRLRYHVLQVGSVPRLKLVTA